MFDFDHNPAENPFDCNLDDIYELNLRKENPKIIVIPDYYLEIPGIDSSTNFSEKLNEIHWKIRIFQNIIPPLEVNIG